MTMHKLLTLLICFFSTNLFAHPHHTEAAALHSVLHILMDHGLGVLLVVAIGLAIFKYVNGNESRHK